MPVNPIIESAVGMYPLSQMKKVSAETKAKTSATTQKKIAIGIGIAATVATAVLFRKNIANFIKTLPPSVKDPILNAGQKVSEWGQIALNKLGEIKNAVMDKIKPPAAGAMSMPSWATTAWNTVKSAGQTVGKWAQTGWNFVKNLCVSAYNSFVGLFAKPTVPPKV